MDNQKFFSISCIAGGSDAKLFAKVINQGIDSHLEAFTFSKFYREGNRLFLDFARKELPILIRRLNELETEESLQWSSDIETLLQEEENAGY